MQLFKDFIDTVGLDKTFFYQLIFAMILYFVSLKLFLKDYLENFLKAESLTLGRMGYIKDIESQIEQQKKQYQDQAQKLHVEFQKVFEGIQKQALKHAEEANLKVKQEQKAFLRAERISLKKSFEELKNQKDKEELAGLANLLVEKMK